MSEKNPSESHNRGSIEESRRKFMKAAGKLAAYTPPTMVLLMQPTRDAIAQSPGGTETNEGPELPPD